MAALGSPAQAGTFDLGDLSIRDADKAFFNVGLEASSLRTSGAEPWQGSLGIRSSVVGWALAGSSGFVVVPQPPLWWGYYATTHYDFGDDRWRSSVGVGGGSIVGLELGAVALQSGDSWTTGAEAAALFTLGYAGLYVRDTWTAETGAMLDVGIRGNWPVWMKGRRPNE